MLRAVLLDVGGTIWPDRIPFPADPDPRLERLGHVLPWLQPSEALATLREQLVVDDAALEQSTHTLLANVLRPLCPASTEFDVEAVRRALCAPVGPDLPVFPGAAELLAEVAELLTHW